MQALFYPETAWKPVYGFKLPSHVVACQNLYSFLLKERGLNEKDAEKYARMIIMKRVYPDLEYDRKDEAMAAGLISAL